MYNVFTYYYYYFIIIIIIMSHAYLVLVIILVNFIMFRYDFKEGKNFNYFSPFIGGMIF